MTAQNGVAAIELFTQHQQTIAAVLLDMMMPEMDGLQTLDRLLAIDPQVIVVACSGLRTSQRETEVLKRGAKAFLPKPYSVDRLVHTLTEVLKPVK